MLTGASLKRCGIRGHRDSYRYTRSVLDLAIGILSLECVSGREFICGNISTFLLVLNFVEVRF